MGTALSFPQCPPHLPAATVLGTFNVQLDDFNYTAEGKKDGRTDGRTDGDVQGVEVM